MVFKVAEPKLCRSCMAIAIIQISLSECSVESLAGMHGITENRAGKVLLGGGPAVPSRSSEGSAKMPFTQVNQFHIHLLLPLTQSSALLNSVALPHTSNLANI